MRRNLWIVGAALLVAGVALWAAVPAGAVQRESAHATARVVRDGEYRFLHENQVFSGTLEEPLEVGATVDVRFDPADPTRNHPAKEPLGDSNNRIAAVAGAFALALGLGFLVGAARFRYLAPLLLIFAGCKKPPPPMPPAATLELVAPTGPMQVREGDVVQVVARQKDPVLQEVWLERKGGDRVRMTRKDPLTFEHRLAVDATVSIRAVGPPETPWVEIRAIPRPKIASVKVRLTYPAYLKWPDADRTVADLAHGMPMGTTVELEVEATGPTRLRLDGTWMDAWEFKIAQASHRGEISIEGGKSVEFEARGVVDQPPTLRLGRPNRDLLITPDAKIPVELETADDLGVTETVVIVSKGTAVLLEKKIGAKEILEIPSIAARDKLTMKFVVRDGLQEVSSRVLHLRVANREEAVSIHESGRRVLRDRMLELAKNPNEELVRRLLVDVRDLRDEAEMNGFLDDALRAKLGSAEEAVASAIDAMKKGEMPVVSISLEKAAEAIAQKEGD